MEGLFRVMEIKKEFKEYFEKGYKVIRNPILVSNLNDQEYKILKRVYNIKTKKEELLLNIGKHLIIIRNNDDQKEFITDSKEIINIVEKQYNYQLEPIGSNIRFHYLATGGIKHHYPPNYLHIDSFIVNLNKILNVEVKKELFPGAFQILLYVDTLDNKLIDKKVDEIINYFNYFSIVKRIGFQLLYYNITPVRRDVITAEAGKEQYLLPPVNEEKIRDLKNITEDVLIVCDCLNQAYISPYEPNRFIILWSIIEKIFCRSSEHLLDKKELDAIKKFTDRMGSLKQDDKRFSKFISIINNKNVFPKENRNEIIAKEIFELLKEDNKKEIEKKIRRASKIRGNFIHYRKVENIEEIKSFNRFFENILLVYIKKYINM